jgi:diguanylate cyclase (GGDEF)-like protein/PAS domain S-box-containing protein
MDQWQVGHWTLGKASRAHADYLEAGSASDMESGCPHPRRTQVAHNIELARLRAEVVQLQEELRRARQICDDAQRLAQVGSWEWDLRSGEVFWSDEMYRLHGYAPRAIPVDNCTGMAHTRPEDRERRARWIERMHANPGEEIEERLSLLLPDGSERPIIARAVLELDETGEPVRYVGTNQDRSVEARSHETERLLSQIVMSTGEAIYTVDLELRVLTWNPGAERLYGYTADEMIGQSLRMLYPESRDSRSWQESQERRRRLLAGDFEFEEYETVRRHKDGSLIQVAATTSPLRDDTGKIIGLVGSLRDITERRRTEAQLAYLANNDPLTGLFNRSRFEEELNAISTRTRQCGCQAAVLMIDLDNFKYVNETYGHKAGDDLVASIAEVLRSRLRPADALARFGGDEFGIVVVDTDAEQARALAEELIGAVRDHELEINGRPIRVTASIGVVIFDGIQVSVGDVLADVDRAMYQSKEKGRNRATVLQPSDRGWVRDQLNRSSEHVIRDALAHDHFELFVQPIVNLGNGYMTHCEALLRLRDGENIIAPGQFLPAAERLGLIHLIDRWVIDHAFELAAKHDDLIFELNLSGATIDDTSLVRYVAERLEHHGTDPYRVVFELTETAAIGSMAKAREMARSLSDLGCKFAIDDFGTGFSTFYYLKYFPAQYVKIDGEFLSEKRNRTDDLVIESIVKIARDLGKQTIAEYVSDEARLDRVRSLGVDYGQGYHFAAPFPAEQLADYPRRLLELDVELPVERLPRQRSRNAA